MENSYVPHTGLGVTVKGGCESKHNRVCVCWGGGNGDIILPFLQTGM